MNTNFLQSILVDALPKTMNFTSYQNIGDKSLSKQAVSEGSTRQECLENTKEYFETHYFENGDYGVHEIDLIIVVSNQVTGGETIEKTEIQIEVEKPEDMISSYGTHWGLR